jgi:hypothetical protein
MKIAFEFILFHEHADGTTTFFQFHIVGVPLKGRDEKVTDKTQRGEDQGVAGQIAAEPETAEANTAGADNETHREEGKAEGVVVRR